MTRTAPPVVVLGFDAMDPGITRQMAEEGRLPHFAAFFRDAAYSTVTNPPGLVVGSTWPSFWTGLWPSRHGFYCYRQLEPRSYRVRRYTPKDITAPPFWMPLAGAGRRVCIVDVPLVPLTRPADGIHVIDWGTHDRMLAFAASPVEVEREIAATHHYPLRGTCDDYAMRGAWSELYDTLVAGIEAKTDLNLALFGRGPWDVFASVYCESHCAGHQFWWAHDPQHPRFAKDAGDPLLKVYEALDRALGRMLEQVPPDAHVFVLLSHGIGNHNGADHLLREIVIRLDHAYAPPSPVVVLREKAWRLLRRNWERLFHGGAELEFLDPRWLDASRRFIRLPNNELYGGIRINLAGREPRGRVQPGEAEAVMDWLERELRAMVDPDRGVPVVRRVMRTGALYSGDKLDALPDVMVDWERSAPIRAVHSPSLGTIRAEYDGPRSGDHRPTGMVFARGPRIAAGRIPRDVKMVDLAPTFAAVAGLPATDVDGTAIPIEG